LERPILTQILNTENVQKPKRRRSSWVPYAFIVPFFVVLLLFGIVPLLFSLWVSFNEWGAGAQLDRMRWTGLWTYHYTLEDKYFIPALLRTVRVALFTALPQHLIALPLAYVLHMAFKRLQGVLGTVLFLPYMTSSVAAAGVLGSFFAFGWQFIDWGFSLLGQLPWVGQFIPDANSYFQEASTAFSSLYSTVGWNVLLYLMILNVIPRSVYEAAQLDGAGFWRMFRSISLPLMRPMIFVAFVMSFLKGIQNPGNDWGAGFNQASGDLPTYILHEGFWNSDMGLASEMTVVFFLGLIGVVLVIYALIGRNFSNFETSALTESDQSAIHFPLPSRLALKLVLALSVVASILPVIMVLLNATRSSPASNIDFSAGDALSYNLETLLNDVPTFWQNMWNSVYICTLAAVGVIASSSLAGYAFSFLEFKGRAKMYSVVVGMMLFPSLLNAIPTVMVMVVLDWTNQARAVWVPATASAFGVFLVRQFLTASVPNSLLEAARMDGASEFKIFWSIVLPLARPVLATLGLLTFVTVWNNYSGVLAILRDPETHIAIQAMNNPKLSSAAQTIGIAIATIPALLLFLISAGQIAKGMNITSDVKFNWRTLFARLRLNKNTEIKEVKEIQEITEVAGITTITTITTITKSTEVKAVVPSSALSGADGLRALACLMVIFHHLAQRLNGNEQPEWIKSIQAFIMQGSVGVSAFFVLSGMLLAIPFWKAYLEGKPFPNLLEFTKRRMLRIAPGFYASLVISVLLTAYFVPDAQAIWTRLVAGLTFTSALNHVTFFPADLNGPLWSIGFEVICYALMPLGMAAMFALYAKHSDSDTRSSFRTGLLFWFGILAVVLIAHQLIIKDLIPDSVNRGWEFGLIGGAKSWMPNYNAIGMFGHYILGVMAAGVIVKLRSREQLAKWGFDLLALAALVGMIALLWTTRFNAGAFFSLGNQPYFYPAFPLLIAIMLATLPFSRVLGRLFDNPFARYTAKLSFGLYIWHFLILEIIRLTYNPAFVYFGISTPTEHLTISITALVLAYITAAMSYRFIEEPFLRQNAVTRAKLRQKQEAKEVKEEPEVAAPAVLAEAPSA
jgi:ABC-type glycerol-3-phosphate transport system permease component/peptidoglycan/LPS O-acetylase OafA/YrhL